MGGPPSRDSTPGSRLMGARLRVGLDRTSPSWSRASVDRMSPASTPGLDHVPAIGRAKLATLGLTVCGVLSLLAFGFNLWLALLLPQLVDPAAYEDASLMGQLEYLQDLEGPLMIAWGVVFLLTAVLFSRWMYRAYRNVHALASGGRLREEFQYTPSGAVWSFYIPFINLVRPCKAMAELWRRSAPDTMAMASSGIIGVWWAMWLGGTILRNQSNRMVQRAGEDLEQLSSAVWVGTVAELLMTVAAVLAIVLIRQIGRRQAARADWLAAMVHGRIDPARG